MTDQERIVALETRIAQLEARISMLEARPQTITTTWPQNPITISPLPKIVYNVSEDIGA